MGTRWLVVWAVCLASVVSPCFAEDVPDESGGGEARVAVVVGATGLDKYGPVFGAWADRWVKACEKGGVACEVIGLEGAGEGEADLEALRGVIERARGDLWLVLIGHGTYNGRDAKFNLRGRDVSAKELAGWLREPGAGGADGVGSRVGRVAVVNGASASAPFISTLSGQGRVVVTSTKSGSEQNFAHFGGFIAEAIGDPGADLDKDGQTSLLEAYLTAARRVEAYYEEEGLLASEHALLDDNGDGQGTRAEFYRGIRPIKKAKSGTPDGYAAHQWHLIRSAEERALPEGVRSERDRLEMEVLKLRDSREDYEEKAYFKLLEEKMVRLAEIYEGVEGE